ncbi:MAG: DUF896 domain-containing protein [Desulfotomaculaceae bacterium]|nr:DUF896 domain-containing protein [Desulfotomaculaceae bacterium]
MISKDLLEQINYLAKKQRNQGLTVEEKKKQRELRERYLEYIRSYVSNTLESAGFKPKNKKHGGACDCENCTTEHERGKNYLN